MNNSEPRSHIPLLPSRNIRATIVVGFFLLTFTIYFQSIFHEFVRWDDGLLIYENPAIRAINWSTLKAIFTSYDPELYIPLTFFTYQIDFLIGGIKPNIYHFQNLVWHTLNAVLVTWFAFAVFKKSWMAVLAGLLFAVHPLHTEAVAWASARKDVLATFFFLLSAIAYVYYRDRSKRSLLWWSVGAFLLGLLSKVVVITLPIVLILLDIRERRPISRQMIVEKIPYFVLSIIFGIIAINGKTHVLESSSTLDKIFMAGKSALFSVEKIVWPTGLSVLYPYPHAMQWSSMDLVIPTIIIVALMLFAAALVLRKQTELFCWLGFFLLTMAPTFMNFTKGTDLDVYFSSDRYAYIPSIGILFLACLGIAWLWSRTEANMVLRRGIPLLCIGMVGALSVRSHLQAKTWESSVTLFENVLKHYPSHVAYNNLGNTYRLEGDLERAIDHYHQSLAIRDHAKTHSNLAATYRQQGDLAKAHAEYEQALAVDPENKHAHFGRAVVYAQEGKYDEALAGYLHAIDIDPRFAEAHMNLGTLYAKLDRTEDAVAAYEKALEIEPYSAEVHYNLALAQTKLSKIHAAFESYKRAVNLQPSFVAARINLGIMFADRKMFEEAIAQFEAVLYYDPGNKRAESALQQLRGRRE